MEKRNESNWEFALVIRSGLDQVVADLRRASLKGVCLYPGPDETGGELVKISDLELIVTTAKQEGLRI